jgi:hypothetical protein
MSVLIQRKTKGGEEVVQVIPREAVVMVELMGDLLTITTGHAPYNVEVRLKPEQVEGIKAQLFSFAEGKVMRIVEKE